MTPPSKRGAALLTVLLLVAVMSALAAAVLDDIRFSVRRTTNAEALAQGRWYALGAETLARRELAAGLGPGLMGEWRNYPVEGGTVRARLEDGGACFNLNSVAEGSPGHWLRREGALRQYRTLLATLGLPERRALELSEALSDWIDSDSGRTTAGAEDDAYAGYRTSSALLQETSELRAVRGYDAAVYSLLRPYVCALPGPEPTLVNINELAADKAALLTALSDGAISPDAGRRALSARPKGGWRDVAAFLTEPLLNAARAPAAQLSVRSRYYELTAQVDYAGGDVLMTSLIEQQDGGQTALRARRWTADE